MKLKHAKKYSFFAAAAILILSATLGSFKLISEMSTQAASGCTYTYSYWDGTEYFAGNGGMSPAMGTNAKATMNLTEDETWNVSLNDRCALSLNGFTLTSSSNQGSAVSTNGDGAIVWDENSSFRPFGIDIYGPGTIVQPAVSSGEAAPVIKITSYRLVQISNLEIINNTPGGEGIRNNGVTTLEDITTEAPISNGSKLTINSGDYSSLSYVGLNPESTLTINGGNFDDVDFSAGENITIVDGDFTGANIPAGTTITGGTFDDTTTFANGVIIEGGTFAAEPDPANIPAGKRAVLNDDGTYGIEDAPEDDNNNNNNGNENNGGENSGTGTGQNNNSESNPSESETPAPTSDTKNIQIPDTGYSIQEEHGSATSGKTIGLIFSIVLGAIFGLVFGLRLKDRFSE